MSEFRNVAVVKKANVFFDGRFASRTILFPGEYTFNTGDQRVDVNDLTHLSDFRFERTDASKSTADPNQQ